MGAATYGQHAKSSQLPGFGNYVFLERDHARLFMCCLWLSSLTMAELRSWTDPQNLKYLLSDSL